MSPSAPTSPRTVLITGSSSGIGRATARHFQEKGFNVIATMRRPREETELNRLPNVLCYALDVCDPASIKDAIEQGIAKFARIDVVVNNAGYGLTGPLEGASDEQIERQFNTNVFGPLRVMKAVLPHFRENGGGRIINVASMGGRLVFPYYSLYHGTKWALEGASESLRFELEPLGIQIKIIEPGAIKTDFYDRSVDTTLETAPAAYRAHAERAFKNMNQAGAEGSSPEKVARTIFLAATDSSRRVRYPVGMDAKSTLFLRRLVSDSLFASIVRGVVFK